jgi:hypothetical protein
VLCASDRTLREAVVSRLHAGVRLEEVEEEGITVVTRSLRAGLDPSGRPRTGAYLGKRLVPRSVRASTR